MCEAERLVGGDVDSVRVEELLLNLRLRFERLVVDGRKV